jgi:hypothetical protein
MLSPIINNKLIYFIRAQEMNDVKKELVRISLPLLLSVLVWTGCTPTPTGAPSAVEGLPLTTLGQGAPLGDQPVRPLYAAITRPESWSEIAGRLPAQAAQLPGVEDELQQAQSLLIVAFAGVKGSSGYDIHIESIVQEGDRLRVTVSHTEPVPNENVEPARTLPYHIVALPREVLEEDVSTVLFQDTQGNLLQQEHVSF